MNTRYGAYGVILQGASLLLTLKKSGPYKGLWGLPGGAIEFGESPEVALKRELLEETALAGEELQLLTVASAMVGQDFHQIGIIYKVGKTTLMPNLIPEEEGRFFEIQDIKDEKITQFAKFILRRFLCGA